MNNLPTSFIKCLKKDKVYTRLQNVCTMLYPSNVYTNRLIHTEQVAKCASKIANKFELKLDLLTESCYCHDLGHCAFAHEGEMQLSKCIAKRLKIKENKISFKHSINGALVLAFSLKSGRNTELSNLRLLNGYKNQYKDAILIIVDSIVKHSINSLALNGAYFKFINEQFLKLTGFSLDNKVNPISDTGYIVRVADDIASKCSDLADLYKLLTGAQVSNKFNRYQDMLVSFLYDSSKEAKNFTTKWVCDNYDQLEIVNIEKSFLKLSYGFNYKKRITKLVEHLYRSLFDICCEDVNALNRIIGIKGYHFVKQIFNDGLGKLGYTFSNNSLKEIKDFYKKRRNRTKKFRTHYSNFLCSVAFELSTLTDKKFLCSFDDAAFADFYILKKAVKFLKLEDR